MLLTGLLLTGFVVFLTGSAVRAYLLLRLPIHGRWELYPVPGEKGRAAYGGSYYEENLWWQRPRATSFVSELGAMLGEMLFIRRLREHQKSLWWASVAFHWGLYCLAGFTALLAAGAAWEMGWGQAGPAALAVSAALRTATATLGGLGVALGLGGTLGLLARRLFDPALRLYSGPREYFHLALFAAAYVTALAVYAPALAAPGGRLALSLGVMKAVLTLAPVPADVAAGGAAVAHLVLLGLVLIYIPLSRLSHYVAKFVTYHRIQWDNGPNLPGSRLAGRLAREAGQPDAPGKAGANP